MIKITLNINGEDTDVLLTDENVKHIVKASKNVKDRIRSFQDACDDQGLKPSEVLPYQPFTTDTEEINTNAYVMLKTIFKSLNGDWKADWSNSEQVKYYPWLKSLGSGLGLSFLVCDYDDSLSSVGSRLVLRSSELAEYAAKQFINIYNQYNN